MRGVLAKMTAASREKIQKQQRRIIVALVRATGTPDLQSAIAKFRELLRSKDAPPIQWIHRLAQSRAATLDCSTTEPDTIPLERFDEILASIDTPEKCDLILSIMPEDQMPAIAAFQHQMLHEIIPQIKKEFADTAKLIPRPPSGGRPTKMPNTVECSAICNQIAVLIAGGTQTGLAQRRIAAKTGRKVRSIQRIWQQRKATKDLEEKDR